MIDRLVLISSMLLIVLTVVFAQFMDAEKFWRDKAIDVELRLLEHAIHPVTKAELERKRQEFSGYRQEQSIYARVFAAFMGVVVCFTAFCFPMHGWKDSTVVVRATIVVLMICLLGLASVGWLFALGGWRP